MGLLFAAVGVAVLDDYGFNPDESTQRHFAQVNADYITGDRDALTFRLTYESDRFYGVAFELPLLMVERLLGLQDSRSIYLSRHLITHLFFIAGGFCCGLLVWRMFGSRWLALLAMLLFLLHPRLYAHSFFNSKDIPFLVMFIIALYLTHRAFRRDTPGAFVLLGITVGIAANLRPFALLLLPAVLAMRGLDLWQTPGDGKRRILLTGGVFTAAALLAIYASHPYYWENPLRFFEMFQVMSQHPTLINNLFQGQIVRSDAVPAEYIPVWFSITAPPGALLLGIAGIAAMLWQGGKAPGQVLRKGELRFLFLLLACLALPVVAAIVLQAHIYHGWRQMYFLWAPFCLLAAAGIHCLTRPGLGLKLTLPIVLYGLAAAGLGGALYAIVSLHPHQQIYFNLLANRAAPGELRQRWDMDYGQTATLQGLEYLLARYPDTTLYVMDQLWTARNRRLLPAAERERIALSDVWAADFHILSDRDMRQMAELPDSTTYRRRAYDSVYLAVTAPRLVWGGGAIPGEEVYRETFLGLAAAESLAARSHFDVYIHDGVLYYVKENCSRDDATPQFFLHFYPVNNDDLPHYRREYGYETRKFNFSSLGGFFDGKCITREPLPGYDLARISTGQENQAWETMWQVAINPSVFGRFQEIEAGLAGLRPVTTGDFELYWDGGMLVYRRETCAAADAEARFYLHLFPADAANLPAGQRDYGFVNQDFNFLEYGAIHGGKCLAAVPLPNYDLARIRTGQFSGSNRLWQAELAGERLKSLAASEAIAVYSGQEPAARAEWNVYVGGDNRLIYLKGSCAAADTAAKFYLHIIPQDVADLPAEWQEIGFENRDFRFADRGAIAEGQCAATAALPDYPIARIRTGQHIPGQGQLWQADFPAGR